jgi:fermentation-respiration switch protein FrsA (DUF1100 family)
MTLRTAVFAAIAVGLIAVIAVLCGSFYSRANHQQQRAEYRQQLAALQRDLDDARQQAIALRQRLRDQTLRETVRTPDEFLALFPAPFPQGDWRPAESHFEDCWFRSADGLRLHGWLLRHEQPREALLLVHGNAGNVTQRARTAQQLSERCQASVFVFDYRGYGRSEGTPTIPGLLIDARAARAFVAQREGMNETDVILFGESLGGAITVELAAEDGARALVLQSTFASFKEVAAAHYPALLVDALVANRLNSAAKIAKYRGPLFQVHGDSDRTIPLAQGRRLFDTANMPKTFLSLPGHDHNDPCRRPTSNTLKSTWRLSVIAEATRSRGRIHAFRHQRRPQRNAMKSVHLKHGDRSPADGRATDKLGAAPTKVPLPAMPARIEEPYLAACLGIDAGQVRSFVMIVGETSQGEIAEHRRAAVLLSHNMIEFVRNWREFLRQQTILAAISRSSPNLECQSITRGHSRCRPMTLERSPSLRVQDPEQ